MLSYLVRRLLLFFPTLIGATVVIFMTMFLAPISIVDVLLPPGGEMLPGQRAVREQYLQERYGLNKPAYAQYLRWLNRISPVGFRTWERDDPEVVAAKTAEEAQRQAREQELVAAGAPGPQAAERAKVIDVGPDAGDVRLSRPAIKAPDLGNSFIQARPAWDRISESLPVTIALQAVSLPIALTIALFSGIRTARLRGQLQDRVIGGALLALYAIPVIWVGVMLIGFLANVEYVKAFPTGGLHDMRADEMRFLPSVAPADAGGAFRRGYLLDTVWHLVLPVVCISYGTVAYYSKLTRTSLLEVLNSDYVRTARAKGLADNVVLYRHAFRNSLLPLITVAAGFLPRLVTGSIVVEMIFGINGMGRLAIEALYQNDRELFLSVSVIILLLQLGGNLLADVLYTVADPRVSYDK
jgi:ABC-type dipeptide/oligopeptide/nickel transport system permease component